MKTEIIAAAKARAVARLVALWAVNYAEQGQASGAAFDNVFNFEWHYDYYVKIVNEKYEEPDADGIISTGEWLDEWLEAQELVMHYIDLEGKKA